MNELEKITFELRGESYKKAVDWVDNQRLNHPRFETALGERFSFIFTPNGLGVSIKVIDLFTKEEIDVTNTGDF